MTPREFFDAVVEMRRYQIAFERSRGKDDMAKRCSKDLEHRIDHEIARVKLLEREKSSPRLDL